MTRRPALGSDDQTLSAIAAQGWQAVLLGPRSKRPCGSTWQVTSDTNAIRRHLECRGNIGLVCGPASNVAVVDIDDLDALRDIAGSLGALAPWVETGSGKVHCYVRWQPNLPAKLTWRGRRVGEVQRGGMNADGSPRLQHVVMPPSVHPDTGRAYRWLAGPSSELPTLPAAWRAHLAAPTAPAGVPGAVAPSDAGAPPPWIPLGDLRGVGADDGLPWDGPAPAALLQRAARQPGASVRAGGVKFQCPGCRAEGRDRSRDNAWVRGDGRFGCAIATDHRRAIAVALSVVADDTPHVPGYSAQTLRQLGLRV